MAKGLLRAVKLGRLRTADIGLRSENYLGVECGGTRSVALLAPCAGGAAVRAEFGAANLRLLDDRALVNHFKTIGEFQASSPGTPAGIVIGMAGARTERDRRRMRTAAAKVWPNTPVYATHDLETALMAAPAAPGSGERTRVLVLSGTGSCCFGRAPNGQTLRVGGWGHILGDMGSGYEIGLRALRAVVAGLDRAGQWPGLGASILQALQLNEPDDLINWVKDAPKSEVAALAVAVFAAAARRDRMARAILAAAAVALAESGAGCARRLVAKGAPVEFIFAGSILLRQPGFAREVGARLRRLWPGARVVGLRRESAWGAIELAKEHFGGVKSRETLAAARVIATREDRAGLPVSGALSPTERRNRRSRNLDRLPLARAITLMVREESKVGAAILKERRKVERAIEMIVFSLRRGGRLFYVGAGTSGRLGILDASECGPTFGARPEQVQGVLAGGAAALARSVEGAEDDAPAGAAAMLYRGVRPGDVVIGIAASGRTPFVWGALRGAKKRGARTVLLCFNPYLQIPAGTGPDLVIAPNTGPEVLTGSTRLKAGTATKIILNICTTLAMARLGKVRGNLMVDLKPSNEKLRGRALRMVQTLTGADGAAARGALEKAKGNVPGACRLLE